MLQFVCMCCTVQVFFEGKPCFDRYKCVKKFLHSPGAERSTVERESSAQMKGLGHISGGWSATY